MTLVLDWSHNYAPQPEILEYIQKATRKYGIYPHIQFKSQIKTLLWDERIRKWKVEVYSKETKDVKELFFDIVYVYAINPKPISVHM